jgi:addiction module HigA family antidote
MRGENNFKTERSRALRHNSANAEAKLWNRLRSRSIGGYKFARQDPIGRYIVDFVCRERRLVIEVDGGQHATDPRDAVRDKWLTEHNYRVLRFWNNDVLQNIDGVLQVVVEALNVETPPHPVREDSDRLSPRAGRGKVRTEKMAKRLPPLHPGEVLREEFLVPLGMSAGALARICGVPRTRIERLADESTAVTADSALRLSKALGTTPEFWLNLQNRHDIESARNHIGADLEKIERVAADAA